MDHPQMTKLVKALEQIGNGLSYIGRSIDKLSDGNGPNKGSITLLAKSIDSAGKEIAHSINNLDTNNYKIKQEYPQEEYINAKEIAIDDVFYHKTEGTVSNQPEFGMPYRKDSLRVLNIKSEVIFINLKDCRRATDEEIINYWSVVNKKYKTGGKV